MKSAWKWCAPPQERVLAPCRGCALLSLSSEAAPWVWTLERRTGEKSCRRLLRDMYSEGGTTHYSFTGVGYYLLVQHGLASADWHRRAVISNHKDNRHAGGVTASLPGHCLWLASEEQTISLTVSLSLHLMGPAHSLGEGRRSGKLSRTAWNSFVQQLDFSSKLKNQEWKDTFFFLKSVCINSAIIF